MYKFVEKPCVTCRKTFQPIGSRNYRCSLLCRVLDCCDVPSDPDGCWLWNRSRDKNGYGEIRLTDRVAFAHRVAYGIITGVSLHPSLVVMHSFDNPPCCNPGHLSEGSQAENVKDMMRKGRQTDCSNHVKGSRHYSATITEGTALMIFRSVAKLDDIAATYKVSRDIVEKIKYGKSWNHVTGLPNMRRVEKNKPWC